MNRILLISVAVLMVAFGLACFVAVYRGKTIESQKERIGNLSANVETLIKGREKDYADKMELAKRNEELEQEAAKDTTCFGWNTDISHSPIVQRLRKD